MTRDHSEADELELILERNLTGEIPPEVEARMRGSLAEFRKRLARYPYVRRGQWDSGRAIWGRAGRWQWALVALAVVFTVGAKLTDRARESRIAALTGTESSLTMAGSRDARASIEQVTRQLEQLLADAPDDGSPKQQPKGGSPL